MLRIVMRIISGHYVYALFRATGEPFYIGLGTGKRISLTLNPNNGTNRHKSAILRQTKEALGSVPWVLLHTGLDAVTAKAYEVALIQAIGRCPAGPLVNLTDGGDGIRNVAPESRAQTSKKLMGNRNAAGFSPSAETRAKLSASKLGNKYGLGRKDTPEQLAARRAGFAKLCESIRDNPEERKRIFGRKFSAESRAKTSATLKGRKMSEESKAKMRAAHARRKAAKLEALNDSQDRGLRAAESRTQADGRRNAPPRLPDQV